MEHEKTVKLRIGDTIKIVSESEAKKWLENQQQVVSDLVSRGISRDRAEKYFKAEVLESFT